MTPVTTMCFFRHLMLSHHNLISCNYCAVGAKSASKEGFRFCRCCGLSHETWPLRLPWLQSMWWVYDRLEEYVLSFKKRTLIVSGSLVSAWRVGPTLRLRRWRPTSVTSCWIRQRRYDPCDRQEQHKPQERYVSSLLTESGAPTTFSSEISQTIS